MREGHAGDQDRDRGGQYQPDRPAPERGRRRGYADRWAGGGLGRELFREVAELAVVVGGQGASLLSRVVLPVAPYGQGAGWGRCFGDRADLGLPKCV